MSIRKILLPLQAVTTTAVAFATAAMIARSWSAHVAVLHITADGERESAARSLFGKLTAEHDLPVAEARPNADNPTASFAALKGREADVVAYQARLADLIVVPHPASDKEVSSSDALHAVLFDSAKPVLIAPRTAASTIGHRICLGWNGTASRPRPYWLPYLGSSARNRYASSGRKITNGADRSHPIWNDTSLRMTSL